MRILYAEDEQRLLKNTGERLIKEGYSVDMVSDGEAVLDYAAAAEYDLFILDILMPGRDGLSALAELRKRGVAAPVLLLTALSSVEDRVAGLDCGADDYLPKPFSYSELSARVRALLRRPHEIGHGIVLTAPGVEMDLSRHTVTKDGEPVELSKKEYSVLEYMMKNAGVTLTREQIESRVWNFDYDGASNVVDVYIRYLRKKLGEDLIKTVRGVGYMLEGGEK